MSYILNINIVIKSDNHSIKPHLNKALKSLNGRQNYFYYNIFENDDNNYLFMSNPVNWNHFFNSIDMEKYVNEFYVYIIETPFSDNWFSHETEHISVITTHSWREHYSPPSLTAYLIYQIVQSTVNFEGSLSELNELRMVHNNSIGCLFDFCRNKHDIKIGMMSGVICPKCESILLRHGINKNAIKAVNNILNDVRLETLGKTEVFNNNDAFIVMHFTKNDENDHAYFYGIKPALEKLNINCIRADDYIQPKTLLNKIKDYIVQSRFIIAKVDEQNLNVYFELGLAMGLNKDVLLIAEKNLVIHLPADLNNWECLTYSQGNYEELKDKIVDFYKRNYHY